MALFIFAGVASAIHPHTDAREWHVGERRPYYTSSTVTFQADGEELSLIQTAIATKSYREFDEVAMELGKGQKIELIKRIRERTNLGLKEAKWMADGIYRQFGWE